MDRHHARYVTNSVTFFRTIQKNYHPLLLTKVSAYNLQKYSVLVEYFFYNCHGVKSSLLSLELSFRILLQGRQTSKCRFYTVCQFLKNPLHAYTMLAKKRDTWQEGSQQSRFLATFVYIQSHFIELTVYRSSRIL